MLSSLTGMSGVFCKPVCRVILIGGAIYIISHATCFRMGVSESDCMAGLNSRLCIQTFFLIYSIRSGIIL
jgi:hypothetical protein